MLASTVHTTVRVFGSGTARVLAWVTIATQGVVGLVTGEGLVTLESVLVIGS